MNPANIIHFNKRQKFVLSVFLLSVGLFFAQFFTGAELIASAVFLAIMTVLFLFFILQEDIKGTFYYPIFILPLLYSFSFILFYPLVPPRLIFKVILTGLYAFGLYSLFLTENIFAVSAIRTINLLRSARIVSFVLTILILFFLINFIFSLRLPVLLTPLPIFIVVFIMNFQSLWTYSLDRSHIREISLYSLFISVCLMQLAYILTLWPVNAAIYSIFLTGIFYTFSGVAHAWIERRLFKSVLWEYIWVGFLSILMLILFSEWGL